MVDLFVLNFMESTLNNWLYYMGNEEAKQSEDTKELHDPSSRTKYEHIDDLNLHPKLDVNIFKSNISGSRIVEKPLKLPVLGNSGASIHDLAHFAGYIKIKHTVGARMFYYFFESRNKKDDPVIIWLTGGPGCSSAVALFFENGPFHLNNNLSLVWNDYGWDKVSNMIYIDQPIGTGFSYSSSEKDIRHDEKGVGDDLYDFLQEFFKVHPDYVKNDLYITGESYGGHYIPAFAARINQGNKNKDGIHLNLKGFAIGNGLTEPGIQFKADVDFALLNQLISKKDYNKINQTVPKCEEAAKKCGNVSVQMPYDLRKQNCDDLSRIDKFLNFPLVKKALGVPKDIHFGACNGKVYQAMKEDIMRNLEVGLPKLLEEGIKMLVYAGQHDFICNWLGNYRWVKEMKWSGQADFIASKVFQFEVEGKKAGLLKNHGPLTFLMVYDAGHMVPKDQPKASLQMLKKWIEGKLTKKKFQCSTLIDKNCVVAVLVSGRVPFAEGRNCVIQRGFNGNDCAYHGNPLSASMAVADGRGTTNYCEQRG
ncbi:hypothetical protein L2E82_33079 [Cichorium intybus]|uniref:Uncharacterized protein n=1 Tax=Cichorium intybus TaxID=13427 RepID=A0ACB9BJ76_CICIN|nr:hypothetical protein L2E82_33079 [Cichorium intybus]